MLLASVMVHVVLLLGLLWFSQGGGAPTGQVRVSVKMVGLGTSAIIEPDVQVTDVEGDGVKDDVVTESIVTESSVKDSSTELTTSRPSVSQTDDIQSPVNRDSNALASKPVADTALSATADTSAALTETGSQQPSQNTQQLTQQHTQAQALSAAYVNYRNELAQLLSTYHHYPRKARRMGWEGTVQLQLVENAQGVVETQLIASSGFDTLDQSAINTLEKALAALPPPSLLLTDQFSLHIPFQFSLE